MPVSLALVANEKHNKETRCCRRTQPRELTKRRKLMAWSCPSCNSDGNDDAALRCSCGYEIEDNTVPVCNDVPPSGKATIGKKIWRGDFSLATTFWGMWFLPNLILNFVQEPVIRVSVRFGVGFAIPTLIIFFAFFFIYNSILLVGVWRSAGRYVGTKLWANLAKASVILCVVLSIVAGALAFSSDRNDEGKDSSNISEALIPKTGYPYIGFWKNNCADGFGLAINMIDEGLYSVSFCGPGGCFEPGTYRPNTSLVGDPNYKIINENQIEVKGADGFSTYYRCK